MTANVCFVDCETTGLDPERHSIWEVALITPDEAEHVWQFPIGDELAADPFALNIGRYWERRWAADITEISVLDAIYEAHTPKSRRKNFPAEGRAFAPNRTWCEHFRRLTAGCHLAGAVVSFDEERLRRLLRSQGVLPRWHYHLIDIEALAAGFIAGEFKACQEVGNPDADGPSVEEARAALPPWDSGALSRAVGVEPDDFGRHTALGDAKWAKAIFEAVIGGGA